MSGRRAGGARNNTPVVTISGRWALGSTAEEGFDMDANEVVTEVPDQVTKAIAGVERAMTKLVELLASPDEAIPGGGAGGPRRAGGRLDRLPGTRAEHGQGPGVQGPDRRGVRRARAGLAHDRHRGPGGRRHRQGPGGPEGGRAGRPGHQVGPRGRDVEPDAGRGLILTPADPGDAAACRWAVPRCHGGVRRDLATVG